MRRIGRRRSDGGSRDLNRRDLACLPTRSRPAKSPLRSLQNPPGSFPDKFVSLLGRRKRAIQSFGNLLGRVARDVFAECRGEDLAARTFRTTGETLRLFKNVIGD